MNNKIDKIAKDIAAIFAASKMTMPVKIFSDVLNHNKLKTSYGTEYKGKRGTYKLVKDIWARTEKTCQQDADNIASVFVDSKDKPAWRK